MVRLFKALGTAVAFISYLGQVHADMSESPFQITFSHELFKKVLSSAGSEVLKILDNIKFSDGEVLGTDKIAYQIRNMTISSSSQPYDEDVHYLLDRFRIE